MAPQTVPSQSPIRNLSLWRLPMNRPNRAKRLGVRALLRRFCSHRLSQSARALDALQDASRDSRPDWFMVPMHKRMLAEALHERLILILVLDFPLFEEEDEIEDEARPILDAFSGFTARGSLSCAAHEHGNYRYQRRSATGQRLCATAFW